jgi:hypothetical protein
MFASFPLSPEDVARLLQAAPGPKYKAALSNEHVTGATPRRLRHGRERARLDYIPDGDADVLVVLARDCDGNTLI